MKSAKFSLKSRFKSFRFALNGVSSLLKNEHNSRIHLVAAIISIGMGIILKLNFFEWSLLIIVIGIVFLAELFNSSVETLADIIDPEWNKMIMTAKDYSAAAVLISAIVALVVGCLIMIPKLINLF
jgi:diacylglycerol kinase (ATP)